MRIKEKNENERKKIDYSKILLIYSRSNFAGEPVAVQMVVVEWMVLADWKDKKEIGLFVLIKLNNNNSI